MNAYQALQHPFIIEAKLKKQPLSLHFPPEKKTPHPAMNSVSVEERVENESQTQTKKERDAECETEEGVEESQAVELVERSYESLAMSFTMANNISEVLLENLVRIP